MADLYARIVLRLIGPALALRERGLAERLEGLSEAAQGPCVNAVADELLKSAGFGDPMPPKNGGDAEAEGAAQPHKPTPSLNARAADALAAANKGQVIRTPVAPAAALAALSGWLGAAGKTILASLSTWREPRASRSSGRNPK